MPRSLSHHHHPQRFHYQSTISSLASPFLSLAMSRATGDDGIPRAPPADMSHHRLGRVVSDLSHSNSRGATGQPGTNHRQSTTSSSNDGGGSVGKAKQRLALLFSGVVAAWTRSESGGGGETSSRAKNRKQQTTTKGGSGAGGARRRGLDIVLAVRKYVAMVEQLFASYSGGGGGGVRDGDGQDGRRRRPNTFTYARGGGGSSAAASKRHKGRLSSAPASLRGSPASSGHLSVGESVVAKPTSTPSEVSTMEELHSAIQAAIAHCKSSAADVATTQGGGGGGDKQPQQRKC